MIFKNLFSALYPLRCPFCGEVPLFGEKACEECLKAAPLVEDNPCLICGEGENLCTCKGVGEKFFFDGLCGVYYYEGNVKNGIFRFKFRGEKVLGEFFAEKMAERLKECFPGKNFDAVTAVPLTKKGLRKRGYNQSGVLGKIIAEELGLPFEELLLKVKDNPPQHLAKGENRRKNVKGVFSVKDKSRVEGKTILLCDDIKTTGATLSECAEILKKAGAEKVYCITAAIAV